MRMVAELLMGMVLFLYPPDMGCCMRLIPRAAVRFGNKSSKVRAMGGPAILTALFIWSAKIRWLGRSKLQQGEFAGNWTI